MNKKTKAFLAIVATGSMLAQRADAQLAGTALVDALQAGGYVLVMRHASAAVPERRGFGGFGGGGFGGGGPPGAGDGEPERELTEEGIGFVTGMRHAFRELDIPVGDVLTSPTLRTRQHATQFGHGNMQIVDELGADASSAALAAKATEIPRAGTNSVIITHGRNITGAFDVSEIAEGETLILDPGNDGATIVARVPIAEWSRLAVR